MNKPSEAILVRMPPELVELLDEYRRLAEGIPSRPEAIRRIVAERLGNG